MPMIAWGAQEWTALAAYLTLLAVILGAGIAYAQLRQIRCQQQAEYLRRKQWETVRAVEAFDTDPTLHKCRVKISIATKFFSDYQELRSPRDLTIMTYVVTYLNYLEAVMIGIEQGVYIEDIVFDHLEGTLKKAVETYLSGDDPIVEPTYFPFIMKIYGKWFSNEDTSPSYRG